MKRVYAICLIALSAILAPALGFAAEEASGTQAASAITQININVADAETLATLKGIGAKKAQAIVDYRKQIGRFKSIEQLLEVKGVGKRLLGKIQSQITL